MRKLLCIANSIAETFVLRTALGLTNDDIRHFSPYDKPDKMRGMDEKSTAIVWVRGDSDLDLSTRHVQILQMYISLGVPQFMGYADRDKILAWLNDGEDWKALRAKRDAYREWSRSG